MEISLYDYEDTKKVINIPKLELDNVNYIKVIVLSGDETISIKLKNKLPAAMDPDYLITGFEFDSSDDRRASFIDGGYILKSKEAIERWLNFIPKNTYDTISYERLREFASGEFGHYGIFERYDEDLDYAFPEIV